MAPKKANVSTPAARVHKAVAPLRQQKFPPRERLATYGKQTPSAKLKQDTLTQIGWIQLPPDIPDSDEDDIEDDDDEGTGNYEEEQHKRTKRRRTMEDKPVAKKTSQNRRRTTGGQSEKSKQYETQTLTQMESFSGTSREDTGEDIWQVPVSSPPHKTSKAGAQGNSNEDTYRGQRKKNGTATRRSSRISAQEEMDDLVYAPPMSSSSPRPARQEREPSLAKFSKEKKATMCQGDEESKIFAPPTSSSSPQIQSSPTAQRGLMGPPPRTPKRIFSVLEIPSSQSPATPASGKYLGFGSIRSPLKNRSPNGAIPFSITPRQNEELGTLPRLRVEDTFEPASDSNPATSTPVKRSSPPKSVRFAGIPDSPLDGTPTDPSPDRQVSPDAIPAASSGKLRITKTEILDSDAETDDEDVAPDIEIAQNTGEAVVAGVSWEERTEAQHVNGEDATGQDTNALDPSHDESVEDDLVSDDFEIFDLNDESQSITKDKAMTQIELADASEDEQAAGAETCYEGEFGLDTQLEVERRLGSPILGEEFGLSQNLEGDAGEPLQATFLQKSQYMESQRLNTQQVDAMAPRTAQSDVFVLMHKDAHKLVNRTKDHWICKDVRLPPPVCRIWIYETEPDRVLRYMAVLSPIKSPGEISNEDIPENTNFNAGNGKKGKFAYEIRALYELAHPLSLEELVRKEFFLEPPSVKKCQKLGPAVLDELMANLLPPIFTQASLMEKELQPSPAADTQEVEAQLSSTIKQFTQSALGYSSPSLPKRFITSPPRREPTAELTQQIRPSQAETVDLTQFSNPRLDVIRETPPRHGVLLNNTPFKPVSPIKLPQAHGKQTLEEHHVSDTAVEIPSSSAVEPDSPDLPTSRRLESEAGDYIAATPVPFSMASSQFLTKSQMMPDSLMADSLPGPPRYMVHDSEDEDEIS